MQRQGPVRRIGLLLGLAAALLGLSGCFKASQDVRVRADGTGSVTLHAEVNKKAMAAIVKSFGDLGLGGTSPDTSTAFKPVNRTFPDGSKVRAVDNADRSTLDASFDFTGPDDYRRKLQQVNEAVAASPAAAVPDDGSIQIRRTGDRMEVALDLGSSTAGADNLDLSSLSGVIDPDALPKVVVTITMPGTIISTNGRTQGRTATWDLLSPGAPATLAASSKVAEPGLPLWPPLLGGALILGVLGVTVTFFLSQRKRAARAKAEAQEPAPGGSWSPPGPSGTATFFPPAPVPPPSGPAGPEGPPVTSPLPPPPPGPGPSEWAGWGGRPGVAPPPDPTGWTGGPPAPPAGTLPGATGEEAPPVSPDPPGERPWRVPAPQAAVTIAAAEEPPPPTAPLAVPAAPAPEPGWYDDPAGGGGLRYWDGARWTQHTS